MINLLKKFNYILQQTGYMTGERNQNFKEQHNLL